MLQIAEYRLSILGSDLKKVELRCNTVASYPDGKC